MRADANKGMSCRYDPAVLVLTRARMKQVIKETLEELGFNPRNCVLDMMASRTQLRNLLIRQEYNECRAQGIKSEALICELASKWCLSYDTVHHVVHAKNIPK